MPALLQGNTNQLDTTKENRQNPGALLPGGKGKTIANEQELCKRTVHGALGLLASGIQRELRLLLRINPRSIRDFVWRLAMAVPTS